MTNHQDAYAEIKWAIDDSVRKAMQREPAPLLAGGCAKPRILDQQFSNALKLVQKPYCYGTTRLSAIKAHCVSKVEFSAAVKGVAQRSSDRILSTTSGPDTGTDAPLSISASR